jgi:hypothetical protein
MIEGLSVSKYIQHASLNEGLRWGLAGIGVISQETGDVHRAQRKEEISERNLLDEKL